MTTLIRAAKWLVSLVVILAIGVITTGSIRLARPVPVPDHPVPAPDSAPERIAEGQRLTSTMGCTQCHGPNLAGTDFLDGGPFMTLPAPNLTGGRVSAAGIEQGVRHGVGADGRALLIMPSEAFTEMADADLAAISGYIASLPDIPSTLKPRSVGPIGRAVAAFQAPQLQPARRIPQRESHPANSEGPVSRYTPLCAMCHGSDFGGQVFSAEVDWWAPNLTSHPTGASSWSRDEFARAIRQGQTPDGRTLSVDEMPWQGFALMTDDEVTALYEYLRSRPPVDRARPTEM